MVRGAVRRRARLLLIVCAAIQAMIGMVLTGLMLNHILGVVVRRIRVKEEMWVRFEPHVTFAGFPYDFRIYSLILFGVLGAWAGIQLVRAAGRMARAEAEGWRGATRASIATAALVIPMLPLQPFALPVLVMSGVSVGTVIVGRMSSGRT